MESVSEMIKFWFALALAALGAVWGALGYMGPVLGVLLFANIADYCTGLAAASAERALSSERGKRGIFKKLGYWIAVAAAFGVDLLLIKAGPGVGLTAFANPVVAPAVAVWLDFNELISILENLGRMGVPLPAFLKKLMLQLRDKIDPKV